MAHPLQSLSVLPDEWNRWAYDYSNKALHQSEEAQALRAARDAALRALPQEMYLMALHNDNERRRVTQGIKRLTPQGIALPAP